MKSNLTFQGHIYVGQPVIFPLRKSSSSLSNWSAIQLGLHSSFYSNTSDVDSCLKNTAFPRQSLPTMIIGQGVGSEEREAFSK
jgi:hypothetical protein